MEPKNNRKKRILLEELEKKSVFMVPESYFDKLSSDIQSRVVGANAKKWSISIFLRPRIAAAALSVLLIGSLVAVHLLGPDYKTQKTFLPSASLSESIKIQAESRPIEKGKTEEQIPFMESKQEAFSKPPRSGRLKAPVSKPETVEDLLAGVDEKDIRHYLEAEDVEDEIMDEDISDML